MAYPQDRWSTGELITAEKMNYIDQAVSSMITIDGSGAYVDNIYKLTGNAQISQLQDGQAILFSMPALPSSISQRCRIELTLNLKDGSSTPSLRIYKDCNSFILIDESQDLFAKTLLLIYKEHIVDSSGILLGSGWMILGGIDTIPTYDKLVIPLKNLATDISAKQAGKIMGVYNNALIKIDKNVSFELDKPLVFIKSNDDEIGYMFYNANIFPFFETGLTEGALPVFLHGTINNNIFTIANATKWYTHDLNNGPSDIPDALLIGLSKIKAAGYDEAFTLLPAHPLYHNGKNYNECIIEAYDTANRAEFTANAADSRSTTNALNISTINDSVDALNAKDTNFEGRISTLESAAFGSTLEIGGRNLLRHTKDLNYGLPFIGGNSSITFETDDEQYVSAIIPAQSDWIAFNIHMPYVNISRMNGQQMTLSAWVKASELATNPNKFTMGMGSFNASNTRRTYKSVNLANTSVHGTKVDNEWCRLSITINVPDDFTSGGDDEDANHYGVFFYTSNTNSTSPLYVRQPQLEFGNVVTDWKPAPEDYYDQALQLKNTENLIVNTSTPLDPNDTTTWPKLVEQVSDSYINDNDIISSNNVSHGFSLSKKRRSTSSLIYRMGSQSDNSLAGLENNKTYTITFDYTCKLYSLATSASYGGKLELSTYSNKNSSWQRNSYEIIEQYTTKWGQKRSGHIVHTFTIDSTATQFALYIQTGGYDSSLSTSDYFTIENLMLIEGTKEIDYIPSINDASLLINKVNGQITTLAEATTVNTQNITTMQSNITQLADSISTTVANEVTTATGGMQSSISELKQTADNLSLSLTQIQNQESTSAWANYQLEDNVGTLTLGQSDSEYKAQVTNTGFKVVQQGTTIASMTQGKVRAANFAVENQLEIGNYMFREDDNGGFYIL